MSKVKQIRRLRRWTQQLEQMSPGERGQRLRKELVTQWGRHVPHPARPDMLPLVLQLLGQLISKEACYEDFVLYLRRHHRALRRTPTRPGYPWLLHVLHRYDPEAQLRALEKALAQAALEERSRDSW